MATALPIFGPNPFNTIPIEIRQAIATFLPDDTDLCSYRGICYATRDSIDGDDLSFWRRRFLSQFERPVGWKITSKRLLDNQVFREQYQVRRSALKYGASFQSGGSSRERMCLRVLRELIIDSFSDKKKTDGDLGMMVAYKSRNLQHIVNFVEANDVINRIFAPYPLRGLRGGKNSFPPPPGPLLMTMRLALTPALLSLNPHTARPHYSFPQSQRAAYSTAYIAPIFLGCDGMTVNVEWALHLVNFWKYHMVLPEECTLHIPFRELDEDERPQWWTSQLQVGKIMRPGRHWKGSYAFIDRRLMRRMRDGFNETGFILDEMHSEVEDEAFQEMLLDVVGPGEEQTKVFWPPLFENLLHATTLPEGRVRTRAQHRSGLSENAAAFVADSLAFHCVSTGPEKVEDFRASGWLNPLPAQAGIPGWQRMTMMKYFQDGDGLVDEEALWAYEGVVLPGGKIIVGRWWSAQDGTGPEMYSGPFIMWCTDRL